MQGPSFSESLRCERIQGVRDSWVAKGALVTKTPPLSERAMEGGSHQTFILISL